jgi:hypothetical protein
MKGLQDPQYEAVRELAAQSRRLGLSLTDYAASFRLFNFFKKSKVDENRIESFILNIQDRCMNTTVNEELSKQKIVNILMELLDVSTSESIPLEDVPRFVTEHTKLCTTLKHVNQLGYHPNRIVAKFSSIARERSKDAKRKNFVS